MVGRDETYHTGDNGSLARRGKGELMTVVAVGIILVESLDGFSVGGVGTGHFDGVTTPVHRVRRMELVVRRRKVSQVRSTKCI